MAQTKLKRDELEALNLTKISELWKIDLVEFLKVLDEV